MDEREKDPSTLAPPFLGQAREVLGMPVDLLDDELARARRPIQRNGWNEPDGLHSILARGVVALEHATESSSNASISSTWA
jgi:hypothetical protein